MRQPTPQQQVGEGGESSTQEIVKTINEIGNLVSAIQDLLNRLRGQTTSTPPPPPPPPSPPQGESR